MFCGMVMVSCWLTLHCTQHVCVVLCLLFARPFVTKIKKCTYLVRVPFHACFFSRTLLSTRTPDLTSLAFPPLPCVPGSTAGASPFGRGCNRCGGCADPITLGGGGGGGTSGIGQRRQVAHRRRRCRWVKCGRWRLVVFPSTLPLGCTGLGSAVNMGRNVYRDVSAVFQYNRVGFLRRQNVSDKKSFSPVLCRGFEALLFCWSVFPPLVLSWTRYIDVERGAVDETTACPSVARWVVRGIKRRRCCCRRRSGFGIFLLVKSRGYLCAGTQSFWPLLSAWPPCSESCCKRTTVVTRGRCSHVAQRHGSGTG